MSLPKIRIGVFEQDWHGVPVLKARPDCHYVSLEDVAWALGIPVKALCARIGPRLQHRREVGLDAPPEAAPLFASEGDPNEQGQE